MQSTSLHLRLLICPPLWMMQRFGHHDYHYVLLNLFACIMDAMANIQWPTILMILKTTMKEDTTESHRKVLQTHEITH